MTICPGVIASKDIRMCSRMAWKGFLESVAKLIAGMGIGGWCNAIGRERFSETIVTEGEIDFKKSPNCEKHL